MNSTQVGNRLPTPDLVPVYEAAGDAARIAESYARAATEFAAIGDARGLAYSIRCAASALMTAAGLADELRPSRTIRERAA
ncbi:hypothetical protein FV232_26290 [Methylobacterium sp. WL30]|nr:hypothetical protein FV225_23770 [Methylobacterium sp. WL93]TXN52152.1 hypothetical protein FV227_05145 [Methylobacterium sp. WL119]TXN62013.1 hypothetical protein FV232_26290 [Methylobacterium sp. WL30]